MIEQQAGYNYCALPLAAYASRPDKSRGRLHTEEDSKTRTCFQRDRDRIIHSSAFRRLKHKTQVFVVHHGDNFRTRLTHTLEAAQIARSLARALYVNEDLAEGIVLAHDLGHPPFAHLGEDALVKCMKSHGGFEHNDQSLRIVTMLENRYPEWSGLNLTWETLEGIVKHNGPISGDLAHTLKEVDNKLDLQLSTFASVEAQIAALADDIAYNNHDVEDGLNDGLFSLNDLRTVPLMDQILDQISSKYGSLSSQKMVFSMIRQMIGAMIEDVLNETRKRIDEDAIDSVDKVRANERRLVAFSEDMLEHVNLLRSFLWERMYRHYTVRPLVIKANKVISGLFDAYMDDVAMMPPHLKMVCEGQDKPRLIADSICLMTDRSAIEEYRRLYEITPEIFR